jgi:hypothetical protein
MEPDWTFHVDDENAKLQTPPAEIRRPLELAAINLQEATEACRRAASELSAAIRTSGSAGYGTGWILEVTQLNSADLERVLKGEELF